MNEPVIHVFNHRAMATNFQVRIAGEEETYAAQVARYNQAVNSYNQGCAGMEVDQALQSRVGQGLACPVP